MFIRCLSTNNFCLDTLCIPIFINTALNTTAITPSLVYTESSTCTLNTTAITLSLVYTESSTRTLNTTAITLSLVYTQSSTCTLNTTAISPSLVYTQSSTCTLNTTAITPSLVYTQSSTRTHVNATLGETFFYKFFICWITLPTDLKNWDFKKKKEKGFCLAPPLNCSFLASSEITKKIIISKHHSALVNYIKIMVNGVHVFFFFFAIADLKIFS